MISSDEPIRTGSKATAALKAMHSQPARRHRTNIAVRQSPAALTAQAGSKLTIDRKTLAIPPMESNTVAAVWQKMNRIWQAMLWSV